MEKEDAPRQMPRLLNIAYCIFSLGVFWEVECFNQKWLHHHQLESYSKDDYVNIEVHQKVHVTV
jgi:hypothetical protein